MKSLEKKRLKEEAAAEKRAQLEDAVIAKKLRIANEAGGFYSPYELEEFARKQYCTIDALVDRWIIQFERMHYIASARPGLPIRYRRPVTEKMLDVRFKEDFSRVEDIDRVSVGEDGRLRSLSPKELAAKYGTAADKVVASLTIQESYFDIQTNTFFEAVCPLRKITPRFDEKIDRWLRYLFGDKHELGFSWIASVTRHDRPCALLYVEGPHSTGKQMLALGLTRIWKPEGPPTSLKSAMGTFNRNIASCPLIWGDEAPPDNQTMPEIRNLVGSVCRDLEEKFMNSIDLMGAVRLLITANNDSFLSLKDMSTDEDIEANALRIIHIRSGSEAAEYLESLGGFEGTKDWVDGDKIAAHAHWLKENYKFKEGKRFIVEGGDDELARDMRAKGKYTQGVYGILVQILERPEGVGYIPGGYNLQLHKAPVGNALKCFILDKQLLVTATAVERLWRGLRSDSPPGTVMIGKALASIASQIKEIGPVKYRVVDTERLFAWAEKYGVSEASIDALRSKLVLTTSETITDKETEAASN